MCIKNMLIKYDGDQKIKVYNSQIVGSDFYNRINDEFKYLCRPCYGATVYKFQGKTIREEYNIYDVEKMPFREMYTALSRATKMGNIHFEYNKVENKIFRDDK